MKKNLIIAVVIILLIIGWGIVRNNQSDTSLASAYTIGSVVPLTGGGANLGVPYSRGLQMAADDVNAKGGINDKQLEVVVQDGKLDGAPSVNALQQILFAGKPDIVTVLFLVPANAISPILEEKKIPLVYQAFTRSTLDNPYAFKADFDSETGCQQLIEYAKKNGAYQKLGVIMSNLEFNDLCIKGMKKVEPNIKEYRYTFGETDFRTLFAKAKSDGVDTLMTIGIDPEPVLMFKQLSELKYPIKIMCAIASECIYPDVAKTASPELLEGTLSIDFNSPDISETPLAKRYAEKYPNAGFVDFAWMAIGYDDGTYIAKAMESCAAGDTECLTSSLKKVRGYQSVIGSNGFKNRILQLTNTIYQYRSGEWEAQKNN